MDPRTGNIVQVADDADAQAKGLVPIPADDLARVTKMNRHARRKWAAEQRAAQPKGQARR